MPEHKLTPDVAAFAAAIPSELLFGQVLIRRREKGFELRHADDRQSDPKNLRALEIPDLRPLAQFTSRVAFRPLKAAPNLPSGWRLLAADDAALGESLDKLYPGAVPDWFAAQSPQPPVTSYRQFTARQSGMYRLTTHLDDALAGAMVRACCHADFCMKRRLWTVGSLAPDPASAKSVIPCLEPCAILLEFARKIARLEQQESPPATDDSAAPAGECDFDSTHNPRRRRFNLEKPGTTVK
jgi:sirohydrochlorin cobaltochelatase